MSKKYNQVVCPICGKHFNPKKEGFNVSNHLICTDCYYNNTRYKTIADNDYIK